MRYPLVILAPRIVRGPSPATRSTPHLPGAPLGQIIFDSAAGSMQGGVSPSRHYFPLALTGGRSSLTVVQLCPRMTYAGWLVPQPTVSTQVAVEANRSPKA